MSTPQRSHMPITDAVYGKPIRRRTKPKKQQARSGATQLGHLISPAVFTALESLKDSLVARR